MAAIVALAAAAPAARVDARRDAAGGEPPGRKPSSVAARDSGRARLWMEMRNVDLHIDERAVMHLRRLRGEVVSAKPGEPAVLDDANSFGIRVTSGTVALDGDGLGALLNEYVFAYRGAPLKRLRVRIDGTHLVQSGVLHKGIDLHFEITAELSLEPDGRVRVHPVKTRILGVNGEKLLHALGLHLDNLLDLRGARGASVKGDDLFLEPTKILPPPAITGRLASIRIEGAEVVQEFVQLAEDSVFDGYAHPDSVARNFVNFRGGRLRFGKLLMTDTDLEIVDADARDPLDLFLARYTRQLVAGTSRTLPNLGLRVLMPDYRAVAAPASAAAARKGLARGEASGAP